MRCMPMGVGYRLWISAEWMYAVLSMMKGLKSASLLAYPRVGSLRAWRRHTSMSFEQAVLMPSWVSKTREPIQMILQASARVLTLW